MSKSWVKARTVKEAATSKFPVFRHASCIEKGGRIISSGVNIEKPRTPSSSFSTHAEIAALKRLITFLTRQKKEGRFEIYVARVNPTGQIAFSRPCDKCLKALKDSGVISQIHYTTDFGWQTIEIS